MSERVRLLIQLARDRSPSVFGKETFLGHALTPVIDALEALAVEVDQIANTIAKGSEGDWRTISFPDGAKGRASSPLEDLQNAKSKGEIYSAISKATGFNRDDAQNLFENLLDCAVIACGDGSIDSLAKLVIAALRLGRSLPPEKGADRP
jgi:hypothetical protein